MAGENVDEGKQTGDAGKDTVPKAEFDTIKAEFDKKNQELEDMRMEVFSPEYMEFLDARDKGKGGAKEPAKETGKETTDDDFKGLTSKQIFEKAREAALADLEAKIDAAKNSAVETVDKATKQREVAAFARSHADYDVFRPIMYGLSLDPKNKDLSLQELYDASKNYVTRHAGPSEEEKKRQAQMSTEKPGGDNQSFEKYKKMSAEDTAKESLSEVKDKLGPIPSV